jgi:hypothetical protein
MKKKRSEKRSLPRAFKMPWGKGEIIEEASCKSPWHEPTIQLMKYDNGAVSIRFAHYSRGVFQRAPLIVRSGDLAKLKKSIAKNPRLKKILKALV